MKFLDAPALNMLEADPAFIHTTAFVEHYFTNIAPHVNSITGKLSRYNEAYSSKSKKVLTEANGTLRISSGRISGYNPSEAIAFSASTTFGGWTKQNLRGPERALPNGFLNLIDQNKDLELCFLASLDVTAGNSGSPVIDKNGGLIGIVFDQNPEGMANQFVYDPDIQRATCLSFKAVSAVVQEYFQSSTFIKEVEP
jgi:hypothetical protein